MKKPLALFLFFSLLIGSTTYFGVKKFVVAPHRAKIIKGIVGQPHLINPLYASLDPVDKEISNFIFRGLVKYNKEGTIIGDLAEKWELSEDGKVYTFTLKPNLIWHDGEKFRADDVVFTYQLTQEADYKGPEKESFTGITIEKLNEQTLQFTLKEPFAPFLDRLTLGILPQHKLFEVSAKDLPKDEFNLHPIGTSLWKFVSLKIDAANKKISSLALQPATSNQQPATSTTFRFYNSEENLATAYKLGEINTFTTINPKFVQELKKWPSAEISTQTSNDTAFVLFFNLKGKEILQNFNFRQALAFAIDKNKLPGEPIEGPIPVGSWAYFPDFDKYLFNQEKAKKLLSQFGQEGKSLSLKFCENTFCQELAKEIAKFWQDVGVKVNLESLTAKKLAETVKNRDFEVLLLQQNLSHDPDQYALWHSSQIEPPGLNITGLDNRRIDKFLVDGRKALNQDERKQAYRELQKEIAQELPAIFLIQPKLYTVSTKELSLEDYNH